LVNPVIPEVTNQVCFKVIGNDATVSFAAEAGQLELNVMEPIITESLFESLTWIKKAFRL
jgi:aspartate ammonia-lyase